MEKVTKSTRPMPAVAKKSRGNFKLEVRPTKPQGGQWAVVRVYENGDVEEVLNKFDKTSAEQELQRLQRER